MRWLDFNQYSAAYGGTADLQPLTEASSPVKWLGDMVLGLQQISNSYQGDKNARGQTYSATSGLFENMDFNGGASRSNAEYLFGITLGVPLRLTSACMLLSAGTLSQDEKTIFDYVVKASPGADEPPEFDAVMTAIADPQRIAFARSMTFFSLGFVWMHEAFHTLIGHVDFASEVLGLSLDELNMEDPGGFESDVLQALELDADGAALTNFCLTLNQAPRFGVVADGNVDPAHRVAQAAEGAIIALSMLELRREQLGTTREGRLRTLVGPLGVGKSALALAHVRSIRQSEQATVIRSGLRSAVTPATSLQQIAHSMGVSETAMQSQFHGVWVLGESLAFRGPLLLLLDDADGCIDSLAQWVPACF